MSPIGGHAVLEGSELLCGAWSAARMASRVIRADIRGPAADVPPRSATTLAQDLPRLGANPFSSMVEFEFFAP